MKKVDIDFLRHEIIGNNSIYSTPFGKRSVFYADYTASGRNLKLIENRLLDIERSYANTHTTDDYTGKYLTELLNASEEKIKKFVKADENYGMIATGSGSTGALKRLQEILGIYIPPHTKDRIFRSIIGLKCDSCEVLDKINIDKPVVFIGPYEHHTNELMWREAFAEIVVIELGPKGSIDAGMLERELKRDEYKNRVKYCSFSAGSNITGILSDTFLLAEIAHQNDALIFFDYAAVAPYIEINVARDSKSYFDAVFFSPHKFLGGPGSAGVLIFRKDLYRSDLPPTTAGGGTVDFVGFYDQVYSKDIETREKAGTPPILQTIKTAMAMEIKENIGCEKIKRIEEKNKNKFCEHYRNNSKMVIIGDIDPAMRLPIFSFNIRHYDKYLHPRLVTRLLSDLFGIQSRAGCSCAGPYGHRLLKIDEQKSKKYRDLIINEGLTGIKPGWVRVNLHYVFTDKDIDFLIRSLDFIIEHGHKFLNIYTFDPHTAEWRYKDSADADQTDTDLFRERETECLSDDLVEKYRSDCLGQAKRVAGELPEIPKENMKKGNKNIEDLKYFYHLYET
ncbi:MAG: aminotransferase class V-fold PLP-dependent enzyme [Candidatus Delongbacteria bacterium]